jgi:PAS domain-containing protein
VSSDGRADVPEARLLAAALAQVADAVCLTDAAGRITFANPAFDALYGYDEKAALGLAVSTLGPHETSGDTVHRARDGREVPVRLTRTAAGTSDDQTSGWIYVATISAKPDERTTPSGAPRKRSLPNAWP